MISLSPANNSNSGAFVPFCNIVFCLISKALSSAGFIYKLCFRLVNAKLFNWYVLSTDKKQSCNAQKVSDQNQERIDRFPCVRSAFWAERSTRRCKW